MCAQPVPEWLIPPSRGFRAEDLDTLPNLPPHTELIDGSLVLVSPQKGFHSTMLDLLTIRMRPAPSQYCVRREMTVRLGPRQRPEPDMLVVDSTAVDEEQTAFPPEAVLLVVEVVSPESMERDRVRKPLLYAQAGIPHFWRIEKNDSGPVVYVYELDTAGPCYGLTGIHHARLKTETPYPMDIDLTEYRRL